MKKPFSGGINSLIDRLLILLIAFFVFQLLVELAAGLPHGNGVHFTVSDPFDTRSSATNVPEHGQAYGVSYFSGIVYCQIEEEQVRVSRGRVG